MLVFVEKNFCETFCDLFLFFVFLFACLFVCLFVCSFVCFKPNHTPSGKKTVTAVQVVTAFQVQSIGCRWLAI